MTEDSTSGREKVAFGLVFATVVIVPGLANYALSALGFELLGSAVWGLGYGMGVIAMWYIWIRPLDLTGPDGVGQPETDED
jgi:hypothetical protein